MFVTRKVFPCWVKIQRFGDCVGILNESGFVSSIGTRFLGLGVMIYL